MTAMQKKPHDPTAHLTAEDIENLGRELDAIRDQVHRQPRRARRRRTSARSSDVQRKLELASRARAAVLAVPAGVARRHRRPVGLEDPREHGDRPQRHARPVGLDARPEDPLHAPGSGTTPRPSDMWKHSHNELHHTYTNVLGRDNDLGYGIMRVDEDQRWHPVLPRPAAVELHQRLLLRVRHRRLRPRDRQGPQGPQGQGRTSSARSSGVLGKIRRQATRDYVVHPLLSGPSALHHARRRTSPPTSSATCGRTR